LGKPKTFAQNLALKRVIVTVENINRNIHIFINKTIAPQQSTLHTITTTTTTTTASKQDGGR